MEFAAHEKSGACARSKLDHEERPCIAISQVIERGEPGQNAAEQYRQGPG